MVINKRKKKLWRPKEAYIQIFQCEKSLRIYYYQRFGLMYFQKYAKKKVKTVNNKVYLGEQYQYDPKDIIGQGSYAKVMRGISLKNQLYVAIKVCSRIKMDEEQQISLTKQVHIMTKINHPNIVDLYDVYVDDGVQNIYLVLQYLQGGELYEHIINKLYFSQQEAKQTLIPILDAVRYLHSSGIIHRDLKPENIIFVNKYGGSLVKIIDFGVSQIISNSTVLSTAIGTPLYMAPEIFMGQKYRAQVDVWSIGVILFIMLCGYPPYDFNNPTDLPNLIKKAEIIFDPDDWSQVSDSAKDLVMRMLQKDPEKRIKIPQILKHEWIVKQGSTKPIQNLKTKLKKAINKVRTVVRLAKTSKFEENQKKEY